MIESSTERTNGKGLEKLVANSNPLGSDEGIVLDRQPGTVAYWPHLDQYVINFSIEGTIDSMHSGVVKQMDEKFRKTGLKVLVSGKMYKTLDLPPPMLGGQEIFALEIFELSKDE